MINMKEIRSNIPNVNAIDGYRKIIFNGLKHSFPGLNNTELLNAIDWSISNRFKNSAASLDNNYTKKQLNGTVIDILKYIDKLQPIITSSGVLFKKHKEAFNPLSKMIMSFIEKRTQYKKEMFKYPKGSVEFERYNLYQLLEKLNANAVYGLIGAPTALVYNLYVAESVTRQGRSYISCSITLFEAFLANNMKFNSLNEVIVFIDNVINEKRKAIDSVILDRNVTKEECFYQLLNTADPLIWIPTEKEMELIWERIRNLSNEDINRLYYKNNLYEFCDNKIITDLLIKILSKLGGEPKFDENNKLINNLFVDPNKPPKSIKDDLEVLYDLVSEYVYYPHFYIDKLDRIEYSQRDAVCIIDTDSCIVSFDAWYRYLLDKIYNIDIPIKHEKRNMVDIISPDEFGDRPLRNMVTIEEPRFDYDFYTDETIELAREIEPVKLVPQENLRYAIINIIAYICGRIVVDYLEEYSKLTGSYVEGTKCRLVMKNEFLFHRLLLTAHRRNYASFQLLQEGNRVPFDQGLTIAGLPIDKSTLPEDIKDEFKNILLNDIMTSDNIDQVNIIKKMIMLENTIHKSIMNKELKYYRPDNVAPMSTYADPMRLNGIVACLIYNEMRHSDQPAINMDERNSITKIKINVDKKSAIKIKDDYPEDYEKLMALLNHPILGKKVNTIALPPDVEVPDWVLPFVDLNSIISDSLKNFPLWSIGLNRIDNDSVNYSNIIKL